MGVPALSGDVAHGPDAGRHPHPPVHGKAARLLVEAQHGHAEAGEVDCAAPWPRAAALPPPTSRPPGARVTPVSPHGCTRSMAAPVRTSTPSRRSTSVISSDASGSSAPASRGPGSMMVTRAPKRAMTWPISRPTDPPPATTSDGRHGLGGHRPAVGPVRHVSEDRRDVGLLAGGQDEGVTRRHGLAADLDRHGPGDRGPAPDETTTLRHAGGRRPPRRPRSRWPPPGCARPRGPNPASPPRCRPGPGCAGPRRGGRRRGPSFSTGHTPSRGTHRRRARPRCRRRRGRLRPAPPPPVRRPGPARRRRHRPPPIYRPPQLVTWTGATIGVPTLS